jgi:hypothetical protein
MLLNSVTLRSYWLFKYARIAYFLFESNLSLSVV